MISALTDTFTFQPLFCAVFATLLGAIVGSFLNVVIYRVPAEKSIITPGSHCACGKPIAWHDNIPVVSWLILGGRARCCGAAFSPRYPFVEVLTAGLFLACWLQFPPLVAMVGWVFLSSLVCAAFIDLDHMIIPDRFTIGLGVVGVILSGLVPEIQGQCGNSFVLASTHAITISIHGLLIGSGLVLWIALLLEIALQKEALGFGDVKFVGAIGAFTGWQGAVIVVFGGSVIGSLWLFLAWIWQKKVGVGGPLKSETPEGHPTPLKILSSTPTISLAASRRSPIT